jgi:hypothetical protein
VKTYSDKVEVALAGEHTASSHSSSSGILSVKQRSTVKRAIRSPQHSVGSQVHASLENFSPGKQVRFDRRSQKAVARLFRSERKEIIAERVPCIDLDDTEGSMKRLADSICLIKLIAQHNYPADDFHMDEHQTVQVGHQIKFKDGSLNAASTQLHGAASTQLHGVDGAFNWCTRDFALLAFGMNSIGAHYTILAPSALSIRNLRHLWNGLTTLPVHVCMQCITRRACVETKHVDSALRSRSKSRIRQAHSRISLPQRTQPNCFPLWTSLQVITRFTSSLGPRRNLEQTRPFCSADIICRESLFVICLSPGQPPVSEPYLVPPGQTLRIRAKHTDFDILIT